ncbi:NAD-dependent succinate-semialdehyde dehydrogenase [Corynebacterium sp. LK2537]|uniref:NAD-dependent succinate-semialdehyde dehydrogenase n=1 Tax=Corynebacterium sp. LK2537 TaxID=3110471 RepID=UPI0034CF65AF
MSQNYRVQNPKTDEIEQTFEFATDAAIGQAITDSTDSFQHWRQTSFDERAKVLKNAANLLRERAPELAEIAATEMGKELGSGIGEVKYSAKILDYYADNGAAFAQDEKIPHSGGTAIMRRLPVGPLLGVMPWNFPYYQVARFAAPNLMVGNTILLKHAEICPRSSAAFAQILTEAGLPEGAFINLYATHDQVSTIIADPRVRGVSLTGSERAGSAVAAQAGKALKKCVLELGGTDAYIVLDAADIPAAARQAWDKRLANTGQACTSNKRIIVLDDIYDDFVAEMVRIAKQYEPGDPLDGAEGKYYPLSSRAAAETLDQQVKEAVEAGATLHVGGELAEVGAYYSPAVLTDVPVGSESYYTEFFGPVAEIYRVGSEEEAIALANDSRYGLGGAVFSADEERAKHVASQIETGMIHVNIPQASAPELPFGGIKNSGYGRELSPLAMDEFVNKQTFYVNEKE